MARYVKTATGGGKGAMKFVTGIFHIILLKYCLQATLIKGTVVCYKRQAFYFVCNLRPHFRECRLSVSIPTGESVGLSSPICIIILEKAESDCRICQQSHRHELLRCRHYTRWSVGHWLFQSLLLQSLALSVILIQFIHL
jgi:hypothetical protein